jgi:hypothetical protein
VDPVIEREIELEKLEKTEAKYVSISPRKISKSSENV